MTLVLSLKITQLSLNQLSKILDELRATHALKSVSIKIVLLLMNHLTLLLLVHLFLIPMVLPTMIIEFISSIFSLKQYAFFIYSKTTLCYFLELLFLSLIYDHACPSIIIIRLDHLAEVPLWFVHFAVVIFTLSLIRLLLL